MFTDEQLKEIALTGRSQDLAPDALVCSLLAQMLMQMKRQTPIKFQPASVPLKK